MSIPTSSLKEIESGWRSTINRQTRASHGPNPQPAATWRSGRSAEC